MSTITRANQDGQQAFRAALAARNEAAARRSMTAYQTKMAGIKRTVGRMRTAGELSSSVDNLRADTQRAIEGLKAAIIREAQGLASDGAEAGRVLGTKQLTALGVNWGRPAVQTVEAAINYVDSAAWRASVDQLAPYYAKEVADVVLSGIASGSHAVTIVREVLNLLDKGPIADILRNVRTVQLWSARAGQREIFRANRDVVTGWWWSCALDARTCPGCWAMHGSVHSVDEILDDHHMGRCAMVPMTRSWADLGFADGSEVGLTSGESVFRGLPEADQKAILGGARWLAWRDGAFQFSQLSETYTNPVYGQMRRAASLETLVGPDLAQQYKRTARASRGD